MQMDKIREEEVKTRNLKEKLLAEIAEEEKCCLITGFPVTSNDRGKIIDGLIAAVMKEGASKEEMKAAMVISWMKPQDGDKKSLICLSLGSKIKRDQFLMNVNNLAAYKIKKTFPIQYREAQRKMENVAYCLRQTFPKCVATDYRFDGVILNLIYKSRASATSKYGEWKTQEEFNPLEAQQTSTEAESDVVFCNKSLFMELSQELNSSGEISDEVNEAFKDKITAKFINARSKKLANIIFECPDDARNAAEILLNHFVNNKPRITIV